MKKIYIAGPMTGYEDFNFTCFDFAEEGLSDLNWNPINPAEIDRAHGFWPDMVDDNHKFSNIDMGLMLSRDILAISQCEAIFMLIGWEESKGANMEKTFAEIIGIDIYYENDGYPKP